ncbi:hypothetical protein QBC41DRAFT_363687 [Cercophora samala]|uniref:Uncharacterized protein n=1 Tax=Cercophora samala TaxID=330535 RepID=A0AA40DDD9_9PEZI|nr:hypothetical protein QBC41DRAFT_363687 [Cercophora samala]
MEETFMVQYCCGFDECNPLGIPYDKKRNIVIGGHTPRDSSLPFGISARSSGSGGLYLQFKNGTIIPPKEVGYPPESLAARAKKMNRRCEGYEENSYTANGQPYYKTFETELVGSTIAPSSEDRTIEVRHSRSVEARTTFSVSVGDPLGIVSVSVGFEFATTETQEITYPLLVPAGVSGTAGFTPVYICTKGTLRDCDGNTTSEEESCTAWLNDNGDIQGDWQVVQS